MDSTTEKIIAYVISPLVGLLITIGGFLMRSFSERISSLEKELPNKLNDAEVRQLMADKIDPLKDAIQKLDQKLDEIYKLLMNR